MMRKYTTIITLVLLFLFVMSIAYAQTYYERAQDGSGSGSYSYYTDEDPRFPDWYDVSQEELDYCARYGGTLEDQSDYQTYIEGGDEVPVSQLTLTVQAFKTELVDESVYLYEVAWYVHPIKEDTNYVVYLIDEDDAKDEMYAGFAQAIPGDAHYTAFESETVYEYAYVTLEGQSTTLKVPFMTKSSGQYDYYYRD
jgi:hypothetical protein